MGGMNGICENLDVDPSVGIASNSQELARRRAAFGSNVIPPKASKRFIRLVIDASKDPTLIILLVAGFISMALSFYDPIENDDDIDSSNIAWLNNSKSYNLNQSNVTLFDDNPNVKKKLSSDEKHETAWIESAAILFCVIIVVLVTAINDYSKERQFRKLQAKIKNEHKFSVIRGGMAMDVPVDELVVGDIGRVKYGDLLPADGLVLQSYDLKIDESSLTGESEHIAKSIDEDPILLSGTYAMEGSGKMLITAVGVNSQAGIIMTLLGRGKLPDSDSDSSSSSDSDSSTSSSSSSPSSNSSSSSGSTDSNVSSFRAKSVLQSKLSKLALQIIYCGTSIAILALVILVARFAVDNYVLAGSPFTVKDLHQFVKFFIIAVTILVISIPEGLPLAVALALTYSMKMMMKDNNLVRHLDACETMGNATTICSDKTGTLTSNRMAVVQSYMMGSYFRSQKLQPVAGHLPEDFVKLLCEAIVINSTYNAENIPSKMRNELDLQKGNKTECGLLGFVSAIGGIYAEIRTQFPEEAHVKVYTFNSKRKTMMTAIKLFKNDQHIGYRIFQKGASEIVLSRCTFFIDANGRPVKFSSEDQSRMMMDVVQQMADHGLRTICIAYKDYINGVHRTDDQNPQVLYNSEDEINWDDEQLIASDAIGVAIFGIQDPLRPEVPAAIHKCKLAGIKVIMVTGDNINTARAIATECGILGGGHDFLVLEGKEFNSRVRDKNGRISQTKLDAIIPRIRVLARAQPIDKYTLVKGIIKSKANNRKQREIVAVTGDGTNDGPALKKADVGFAMGLAGTDVAKEASDIILTDDNFSSIVKAVIWGRNIYDSISKFLQFQLTVNVVAVLTAFVSASTISDSPLRAVHMLWINLIMDTLASLALATEVPTEQLLNRKPYGRNKSLISHTMMRNIICHALYQLIVLFVLLFAGHKIFDIESGIHASLFAPPSQHFTIVFNAFVMMTIFNEINCRKVHGERNVFQGLCSNHVFCIIWLSTFVAQILIVQYGDAWFSTAPLDASQWLLCVLLGFSTLIVGQIVATIPRRMGTGKLCDNAQHVEPANILESSSSNKDQLQIYSSKVTNLRHGIEKHLFAGLYTLFDVQFRVMHAFQTKLAFDFEQQIPYELPRRFGHRQKQCNKRTRRHKRVTRAVDRGQRGRVRQSLAIQSANCIQFGNLSAASSQQKFKIENGL